jgi:hypothetical protein
MQNMFDLKIYEYAARKAYLLERNNVGKDPVYDQRNILSWQRSYANIRDQSWPDCNQPKDFDLLPDFIKQECMTMHNFSADHWLDLDIPFDQFESDSTWQLDDFDRTRLQLAILDNLDAIQNKSVIDFATHIGLFGALCLHHGASWVTLTDVKESGLGIAQEMCSLIDPDKKRFQTIKSDINDLSHTQQLCTDIDTVILPAIMNIVTDHYGIMRAVTHHRPTAVIIQNWCPQNIVHSLDPLVYWWQENTQVSWKAYHATDTLIRVGCPNQAWFDAVMQDFDYSLRKHHLTRLQSPFAATTEGNVFDFYTLVYHLNHDQ